MSDIFLSYKSQNRDFAEDVKKRLEEWGYTVWWDQDIRIGHNFVSRIREELESSKAVVVLLSTGAVQPPQTNPLETQPPDTYVLAEAMYGKLKKPLIPIVIPPLEPQGLPPPFNTLKTLKWAESEAIHVALKAHGIVPTNRPKPAAVYRQDVFTTGIPTYTEVDRSRLREFQDLQANLRMQGRVVRLWGATQTGKSVLARRALADFMPIELKGGTLRTIDDFYDSVAIKHAPEIGSEARRLRVIRFLIDSKRPIIVDDFHRMPTDAQAQLIEDAKDLIEGGVNLVLVSIPDCAEAVIGRRAEFKNRSIAIKAPRWTRQQLRQIPDSGFEWLNARVHPKVVEEIICQAHGNPHLVQEYCYKVCERNGILKTFDSPRPVVVSRSMMTSIFKEVGANRDYNLIPIIKSMPDPDAAIRVKWGLHYGAPFVTLPAIVLIVLDRRGAFSEVRAQTIANFAAKIVRRQDRELLTESAILEAGAQLIEALSNAGVPDIVLGQTLDRFFILHADFKVHLHWTLAPQLTKIQPQLEKLNADYSDSDILSVVPAE